MKFFNDNLIRTKLRFIFVAASVMTIVLVFAGFFTYERISYRKLMIDDITTKAAIIAENSNAALVFRDSTDAARILHSLVSQPHVAAAAIYDSDGTVFATYIDSGRTVRFPVTYEPETSRFEKDALVSFKPITVNGKKIGMLYLQMDLTEQYQRFWSYIEIAFFVLIGTLFIMYLVGTALAKNIAAPIMELSKTVQKVKETQDYSLRAEKTTGDETGFLAESFNQMIAQIQERNTILQQSNEALKSAESRYRSTLDGMQEGCQIIGFDWRYLYLNDTADRHNRRSKDELLGKKYTAIWPGVESTEVFTALKRCMAERTPVHMENEFQFPDGAKGWFDLSIEPVPEGIFILSTDITKEREMSRELESYRDHLEEIVRHRTEQLTIANKELESFSYSVSHDLRAPLRHINGFVDLLSRRSAEQLDPTSRRYLSVISDSSKHMGELIDDLLVFSRMGRTDLMRSQVDLNTIVEEVMRTFDQETADRSIQWTIDPLPGVEADPSMIRLVYQNLIGNAIKYSRRKETAQIHIGHKEEGDDNVFFVRDNGVGFDMKYIDKLFGVFQRLHSNEEFEGTGIGLANVQRIINRHGGRTWAEGTVGEGAVFYFSIPRFIEEKES